MVGTTKQRYLIYIAIITFFAQVPHLGYIGLGHVAITTLPMVVVLMLLLENTWKATWTLAITWGINAWVAALLRAETTIEIWFKDPILGLVPRIIGCLASYLVIRFLIKMSKKQLIKDFTIINYVIFTTSVITFIYVGSSFPTGGNPLVEVLWMTITGLIGSMFALSTYKKINENEGSSCSFVLGFMSGIVITVVHTAITVGSVLLFVEGQNETVNIFFNYVTRTSGVIEISVTAFTTLSIYPTLANMLHKGPIGCE